jgi:hypothetical protein
MSGSARLCWQIPLVSEGVFAISDHNFSHLICSKIVMFSAIKQKPPQYETSWAGLQTFAQIYENLAHYVSNVMKRNGFRPDEIPEFNQITLPDGFAIYTNIRKRSRFTDQMDLLKAFDGVTWRNLQERYAYHFGDGRWFVGYSGQRKYGKHTRWQDTEEFKQEQEAANSDDCRMCFNIRAKGQQGIELRDLYRQMHITAKVGWQVAQELVKAGLVVEARINGAEAYTAIEYLLVQ